MPEVGGAAGVQGPGCAPPPPRWPHTVFADPDEEAACAVAVEGCPPAPEEPFAIAGAVKIVIALISVTKESVPPNLVLIEVIISPPSSLMFALATRFGRINVSGWRPLNGLRLDAYRVSFNYSSDPATRRFA